MLKDKKIAVYLCGGIAVYKTADLVRQLIKKGAQVKVAMTQSAVQFITPYTFQILTKQPVYTEIFDKEDKESVSHIHLADWADAALVVPATANIIAKMANGIADDFVSTALLATTAPIFIVPAMNTHMLENPATVRNMETLKKDGRMLMEPDTGFLAEGYEGKGRMPEPEKIIEMLQLHLIRLDSSLALTGRKVLISAGGTKERIDPVRYITNDSSGKMGYQLAEVARDAGAEVTLVSASGLPNPFGVSVVAVESAEDMFVEMNKHYQESDIVIMAAAVSDYKPDHQEKQKMKKTSSNQEMTLKMKQTKDILAYLGKHKQHQYLAGFAAETHDVARYAESKLQKKKADMIIANDVSNPQAGFNKDTNEVTIFTTDKDPISVSVRSKKEVAALILDEIAGKLRKQR